MGNPIGKMQIQTRIWMIGWINFFSTPFSVVVVDVIVSLLEVDFLFIEKVFSENPTRVLERGQLKEKKSGNLKNLNRQNQNLMLRSVVKKSNVKRMLKKSSMKDDNFISKKTKFKVKIAQKLKKIIKKKKKKKKKVPALIPLL